MTNILHKIFKSLLTNSHRKRIWNLEIPNLKPQLLQTTSSEPATQRSPYLICHKLTACGTTPETLLSGVGISGILSCLEPRLLHLNSTENSWTAWSLARLEPALSTVGGTVSLSLFTSIYGPLFFRVEKMQNKTTRRAITTVNGLRTHFDADNRLTIEGFLLKCAHAGGGGGCNYKSIQRSCGRFSTISRSEACILLISIHGDCVGYASVRRAVQYADFRALFLLCVPFGRTVGPSDAAEDTHCLLNLTDGEFSAKEMLSLNTLGFLNIIFIVRKHFQIDNQCIFLIQNNIVNSHQIQSV